MAAYLGYEFVDAAQVVFFKENGEFDAVKTNEVLGERLQNMENAVVPGFYGANPDGSIRTFSRGGPISPVRSLQRRFMQMFTKTGQTYPAF